MEAGGLFLSMEWTEGSREDNYGSHRSDLVAAVGPGHGALGYSLSQRVGQVSLVLKILEEVTGEA